MKKSYNEYSEKVRSLLKEHKEATKDIENRVNQIAIDNRFTDFGREELLTEIKSVLAKLNGVFSEQIRDTIKKFCKEYSVEFKEDGVNHAADMANALKIIDMCGTNITGDLFRQAIEPLKDSYKSLKMINDVLTVKWSNRFSETPAYEAEIGAVLSDYMGATAEINEYIDRLKEVEAVLDYPSLSEYALTNTGYNGEYHFEIRDNTSYSILKLPEDMAIVGKMYERLAMKNPLIFTNYIPTHEDIINDIMKNQ